MVSNVDLSIEQIQELLGVTVDGKLGPQTKDAIKAIQRYGEIAADGIPGPQTTSVLKRLDPNEVRAIVKKFQKPEQKYRRAETKAGSFPDDAEPETSASDAEVKGEAQRYAKLPDAFLTLMEKNGLQILTDSKDPLPSSMYPTLATEFSLQVVFDSTDVQYWLNGLNGISTEIRNDLATKIGTPSPISIPLYVSQAADLFEGDSEFSAWCKSNSTLALRIIEGAGEGNELNGQLVNADGKSISMQSEGILAKIGQSILRSWPELIFGEEIIKIAEEYRDLTIDDNNLENEQELDDEDPAGLDLRATTTVQAGYAADGLEREDKLNLEAEVRALCAIIAARDVEPPLSIGLFGNWGTGKSFFMKEMMTCIRQMATTAREAEAAREKTEDTVEPDYWSNIAQIKFNAWHYEDADLWANLVVRIFDKLAKHVTTGETDPDIIRHERQKLLDEFQSLTNEISEKEEEVKQAAKEHEVAERERAKARIDLEKAERELKQINLRNIGEVIKNRFLADQTEVKKYLDDFGMGDAVESAEKLKFQMSQLRTEAEQSRVQVGALWAKVQTVGGVGWLLAIIILIFVAGLMIPAFIDNSINKLLADAIQLVTQLVIGCGGLFATLRSWLKPINQKIGQLAAAAKDYEKLQSEKTAEHAAAVNAADAIVEELHENLENKESELAEKHERLANLEYDLKESKAGRRLHRFLEQRAASDDYRGKLGIVASIREDFSQLSKMLYKQSMSKRKAWTEPIKEVEDADSTLNKGRTHYHDVDRIVLYIDDLDRCEPSRVIEVLHAVHLLLAFKLFVVVVAVDSRWLVNSLKQSLKNLSSETIKFVAKGEHGTSKEDQALADNLVSTPQNYLEKIFQIPFTLAPMNRDGLKSILEQLAAPLEIEDVNDQCEESTDSENNLTEQTHANIDQVESISESTESEQVRGLSTNDGNIQKEMNGGKDLDDLSADTIEANKAIDEIISVDAAEEASANVNENTNRYANIAANLPRANINKFELEFMYHAFGGLRTPRAANRFVNTYRLIRSLEPDQNKEKFFDKEEGEYKIAISMLILLVGFPTEADPIFQKLVAEKPDSKWEQLLGKIKLNNSQLSTKSRQKIDQVVGNIPGMKEAKVGPYQKWAHKVARYAFRPIELPAKNDIGSK